ncbi:MAG: hypothetical protein IBJ03_16535 [Gemmatimonadaceae bacterium]|nr:hypothetical protein [Gemmatimonadaceae bacterium]
MRAVSLTRSRLIASAILLMAPLQAARAQVGHMPDKSPYEDHKIGQTFTLMGGWLAVKRDPANVAPDASWMAALRYDIGVGGPASLFARYAAAPSQRNLLVPTNTRPNRVIARPNITTHMADIGLDVSLTGRKTYHRFMPSINGGIGLVSDFASVDTGSYRFGTKFAFNYGLSLRYITRRGPQLRIDLTNYIWQYQYPDRYFVLANDTTSILTRTREQSAWRGNWGTSVGIAIPVFR